MKSKWKKLPVVLIGIIAIAVCGCSNDLQEQKKIRNLQRQSVPVPGKQLHRLLMVLILNL